METINNKELRDENVYPSKMVLKTVLGRSYNAYLALLELFDTNGMTHEWRYYRDGKAWLCKVQKKKRTIVWMSAWKGYMQATVYLPEKHIKNVYGLNIRPESKKKFRSTRNVGASKPCIFEIRNKGILTDFEKVMQYKIESK